MAHTRRPQVTKNRIIAGSGVVIMSCPSRLQIGDEWVLPRRLDKNGNPLKEGKYSYRGGVGMVHVMAKTWYLREEKAAIPRDERIIYGDPGCKACEDQELSAVCSRELEPVS